MVAVNKKTIQAVMKELGRRGGSKSSPAKKRAARDNAIKRWAAKKKEKP